jgi:hypothetical protein
MNWQPIETCPIDDVPTDIWSAQYGRCVNMIRHKDGSYWYPHGSGYSCIRDATHWMRVNPPDGIESRTNAVRSDDDAI